MRPAQQHGRGGDKQERERPRPVPVRSAPSRASMPVSAIREPTDRSMPPGDDTRPAPVPENAEQPDDVGHVDQGSPRKRTAGFSKPLATAQRRTRRMKMPSSFFMGAKAGRAAAGTADGQAHDVFLIAVGPVQRTPAISPSCITAIRVADVEDLLHVAADHQDHRAPAGQGPHAAVNFRLGPDVDAARGLIQDHHHRIHRERL